MSATKEVTGKTVDQASAQLGVSRWTVNRMIANGEIRSVMIAGRRIIPSSETDRLLGVSGGDTDEAA